MIDRTTRLALLVICAFLACYCATTGGDVQGRRASRGYDEIEDLQCTGSRGDPSRLAIVVRDQAGYEMPGLRVHLLTADLQSEETAEATSSVTDVSGIARLQVHGRRYYSLVVALVGFVPEVRLFRLEAGCEGTTRVELRVLAIDGMQVEQSR